MIQFREESSQSPLVVVLAAIVDMQAKESGAAMGRQPMSEAIHSVFVEPEGGFMVGWEGSTPIACGGVVRLNAASCEIRGLWVSPDVRGLGHEEQLVRALERMARERGYMIARINTDQLDAEWPDRLGYRDVDAADLSAYGCREKMLV